MGGGREGEGRDVQWRGGATPEFPWREATTLGEIAHRVWNEKVPPSPVLLYYAAFS